MTGAKRIDPADGAEYTLAELEAFYKGQYSKKEIARYWEEKCTRIERKTNRRKNRKDEAQRDEDEDDEDEVESPAAETSPSPPRPVLRRSRSWLKKVSGIALLPCEEDLAELLERFVSLQEAKDQEGMNAAQKQLLQAHPFVKCQTKTLPQAALAPGVTCKLENFRMDIPKFKRWLSTAEGKPFEEKGKGYDDGCYLTSALLRSFMPRGYTYFTFSNSSGEQAAVVLRGFLKFTGLTAADEDEESNATAEADAFMFHGYTRDDASRFVVTTKSNGENGKYTVRKIFSEWYAFAGSKNTGLAWKIGLDVAELYPIPKHDAIAAVGPKIISSTAELIAGMEDRLSVEFMESLQRDRLTVMIELNDEAHEHIFPIDVSWADHVAILDARGYPLPQKEAYAFFDKFGMRRVKCDSYTDMGKLETVMGEIRTSKDTEGAVIYLERNDDVAVGLIKVKSDHYVIARRCREILRNALINRSKGKDTLEKELQAVRSRLKTGMKELKHVGGCDEHHKEWSDHAIAFAETWATAYEASNEVTRKALVIEFHAKFGSLYERFTSTQKVLPLSQHSREEASASAHPASATDGENGNGEKPIKKKQGRKGKN
eukprot:TRINITY_DN91150_c0_g1_i1.p1 TRINITY_DN91150_c0_g1~~TRINITY_DN91150_c0_g1_i1.p1  ORF type:complete len:600 (+),score=148.64 TRINITY_DN91150_c0_g1_i1:26-1825(+)